MSEFTFDPDGDVGAGWLGSRSSGGAGSKHPWHESGDVSHDRIRSHPNLSFKLTRRAGNRRAG
jgi:hypothetical protein